MEWGRSDVCLVHKNIPCAILYDSLSSLMVNPEAMSWTTASSNGKSLSVWMVWWRKSAPLTLVDKEWLSNKLLHWTINFSYWGVEVRYFTSWFYFSWLREKWILEVECCHKTVARVLFDLVLWIQVTRNSEQRWKDGDHVMQWQKHLIKLFHIIMWKIDNIPPMPAALGKVIERT